MAIPIVCQVSHQLAISMVKSFTMVNAAIQPLQ
jgi:hypothetical protein